MKKVFIPIFLLLVFLPLSANAATYYVDATGGNDNSNGLTPGTAWKTVNKVNTEIAPGGRIQTGDDILFKRGETFNDIYLAIRKGGTASDPLVIGAYGTGTNPVISHPGAGITCDTPNLAYITIQDLDIRDASLGAGIGIGADNMSHITISRVNIDNITTRPCILLYKIDTYLVEDSIISNCGNGGIAVMGSPTYPITKGIIRNNVISNVFQNDGITLHADGNYNHVGPNHLLVNNTCSGGEEQGFDLTSGDNVTVIDCESFNNVLSGIAIDWGTSNLRIDRFYSHDEKAGIDVGWSTNVTITNSIIEDYNYVAITSDRNTNLKVYHTTIKAGASNPPYMLDIGNTTGITFKNNIFTSTELYNPGRYIRYLSGATAQNTNSVFANNIWWRADNATSGDPRMWTVDGINLLFFNGWKANFPTDRFIDPKLVDPVNGDLHLQAGSPAIDNGTSVGVAYDFAGAARPQGAGYDIGAYEYVSASGPKTYYVSTTGNDSNPGTQALPWRTIQKAANTMVAGETVVVLAGNYSTERVLVRRSGSAGAPITFQANGNVFTNGFDVDANYTTIKGFNITATTDRWDDGWGIFAVGHHNIFEDNYIYFCIMGGIQLYVDSTVDPTVTNHCIIRNNKLNRNGMNGISVMGRDNLIEGNEIWDTIQHHPNHAGNENWLDADGMHFFGSGHVFRKNYIHNITLGAPWNVDPHTDCWQHWSADGFEDASNILFEQNYCDITTASYHGQGWMVEPGSGGYRPSNLTMRNNIVKAFSVVNAIGVDGIKIIGNTFLNDPSFIAYPNPNGIHIEDFTNAVVKNNILYDMINHPICLTGSGYDSAQTGGNLEYRSDGQALWINDDWCHYNATMRAKDLWGVNPRFVNLATRDYHLRSDSPAIDNGTTVSELAVDYDGIPRPQGAGYDIGAFEYTSGQAVPGDLNNDSQVDIFDLGIVAVHFGQTTSHPLWNVTADVVANNEVDIFDIVFVASRFT